MKPEKSVSLPSKYRFTAAIAWTTSGVGSPNSASDIRRSRIRLAASALLVGKPEACDAHFVPGDATEADCSFENEMMVRCLAHHVTLIFLS